MEVYAGFAADEVLYDEGGTAVRGVATKDMGIRKVSRSVALGDFR